MISIQRDYYGNVKAMYIREWYLMHDKFNYDFI